MEVAVIISLPVPEGPQKLVDVLILSAFAEAFVKACNDGLIPREQIRDLYLYGLGQSRSVLDLFQKK